MLKAFFNNMAFMKRYVIGIMLLTGVYCVKAQNTPFFGHYMFNPTYFNPAWGANEPKAFAAFQYRDQWLGYATTLDGSGGAPSTQMLTAVVPIRDFPLSSIGLNVINDNLGPLTNLQIGLPMTHTISLANGRIGIGATPMLLSQSLNADLYRPNEPDDPVIPVGGTQTQFSFNLNAGVLYQSNSGFFVGVGVQNILEPSFDYGIDGLNNEIARSYAFHAGHRITLSSQLSLSPTVLVRTDLKTTSYDIGAIALIGERVWAGLSYRRQESSILYLGYSLLANKELKIGYSFDYVFVNQEAKAATTHEIFIRYDLPELIFGGRKKVKTPRFSF